MPHQPGVKKFKFTKKALIIFCAVFFVISLSSVLVVWGANTWSEGYQIDNGGNKGVKHNSTNNVVTPTLLCSKVTNDSGSNLFIPTKTKTEWDAFFANRPAGVQIAAETWTPAPNTYCSSENFQQVNECGDLKFVTGTVTCGSTSCTASHTTGSCTNTCSGGSCTACTPSCTCESGWYNCDGNWGNGCESNAPCCSNDCSSGSYTCSGSYNYLQCGNYDADSCLEWGTANSCGNTNCSASNTTGSCVNTCSGGGCVTCTPSCTCVSGWSDCNSNMSDGCETSGSCVATPVCQTSYPDVTVTGALLGSVWGSSPYTDDSNIGVAAVHAGLISVGEYAVIKKTSAGYLSSYTGSSQNGVTTSSWNSGFCGITLSRVGSFSCTGSIAGSATAYDAEESSGLTANTSWTYSASDTATKCQYRCDTGYNWNGSTCVSPSYSCTGSIANNAQAYDTEESSGLTVNTPWTYGASDTVTKCQYTCNPSYVWNGSCVFPSYSCTGSIANNAQAYDTEESSGLTVNTPWAYSVSDTATKCQYTCSPGYVRSGSACVSLPNSSRLISYSVPPVVAPGNSFMGFVVFNNNGGTTWTSNYRLGSQDAENNSTWGTNRIYLPNIVTPASDVRLDFSLWAPNTPGNYRFSWKMVEEMVQWYGDKLDVNITVCAHECTENAKRCSGGGAQTCVTNADSDPCREWSTTIACDQCKTCSNGTCVNVTNNTACSEGGSPGTCQNGDCRVCKWTAYSVAGGSQCRNSYPSGYIDGSSCTCGDISTPMAWYCQPGGVGACNPPQNLYYCRQWYHRCQEY